MTSLALSRMETLRALGVMPLCLRVRNASRIAPQPRAGATAGFDKRVALLRAQDEIEQPALAMLYTKITEAVSSLGLQCVRLADAEADARVRVLAFGDAPLPAAIGDARVLRVDSLTVLQTNRVRKRALWDSLQRLAQEPR